VSEDRPVDQTRREIIQKALYVSPIILTLAAKPAFAQGGSGDSHTSGPSKPVLWAPES
jgi:hypothetical protein